MPVTRDDPRVSNGTAYSLLNLKQRVALLQSSGYTAEALSEMSDDEFTFDMLLKSGARAKHLMVARVSPQMLVARGMSNGARSMRDLGFDALHISDPVFCAACIACFGAKDVVDNFVVTSHDAVALAGTPSATQLDLTAEFLLKSCAGFPIQAATVVAELQPVGKSLQGVSADTVLDTGLRKAKLVELGFNSNAILEQTKATPKQMQKLGF